MAGTELILGVVSFESHRTVRVFLYGTLKRGERLHFAVESQVFVGVAATKPCYRLYSLGTYPGLVEADGQGLSIEGEIWEVDVQCLRELDDIEAVDEGEYRRVPIAMLPPYEHERIEGYLYLKDITGLGDCGARW